LEVERSYSAQERLADIVTQEKREWPRPLLTKRLFQEVEDTVELEEMVEPQLEETQEEPQEVRLEELVEQRPEEPQEVLQEELRLVDQLPSQNVNRISSSV